MSDDLMVTSDLAKAVQEALNPEAIKAAILAEAQNQSLVRNADGGFIADPAKEAAEKAAAEAKAAADKAAAEIAASEAIAKKGNEPSAFSCTENIAGKVFTFEADSQAELNEMVANAYRVAYAVKSDPEPVQQEVVEPVVDPAKEAAAQAELELQFKNGQISAKDYLEKSGAIAVYLAEQGVPVQELKESVETNRENNFRQSWAEATEVFLNSNAGADWPGGERNKNLIGMKLASMGLVDAEDKVAALATAYAAMKAEGMLFTEQQATTDDAAAQKAVADTAAAKVQADAAASAQANPALPRIAQPPVQPVPPARTSSSLFGASSGTSSNDIKDTSKAAPQITVPADATPEQILEAWKAGLAQQNIHPDAAFKEAFMGKR